MHAAVIALLASLSKGTHYQEDRHSGSHGTVGRLAMVYEVARNAMEYRADHLVRRAAIARILRRQLVFGKDPEELADQLLTELQWALYLTEVEETHVSKRQIQRVLTQYQEAYAKPSVPREWLIGLISAEVEEYLNPNVDYQRFTTFAFHSLKNKVSLTSAGDIDLVLYVAVDKTYSQSDDAQISYHLFKLIRSQSEKLNLSTGEILQETWKHYQLALSHPLAPTLTSFSRRNIGPLVLLRDMYFASPQEFSNLVEDKLEFIKSANETLTSQLQLLSIRIRNATVRSLLYVFLTKMLVVILVEMPLERIFLGHVDFLRITITVLLPVAVMWLLTATISLPSRSSQEQLVAATWLSVAQFGTEEQPGEILTSLRERSKTRLSLYYIFYGLLFALTFAGISFGLRQLGYGLINQVIFLFFLCVVSFFAYRIRQTTLVYQYRPKGRQAAGSLLDLILLPVVVVGGWLSSGVARLNFLVFVFDFVLEAPFKLVLRFMDNWFTFLAKKKDEIIG